MKIVLVNYRYFISGGPERYMFNIKEILEAKGHEVIPFSVKHSKNIPSDYENYFLDPIGSGNEVYAGEYKKTIRDTFRVLGRMLYSFEAKRKFRKLLIATKPDLIYIIYFQNKISCSIIDAASNMKIPIVQRISDYSLLCPCNIYYRYNANKICELCTQNNLWEAVRYKCVYNSIVYSFLKVVGIKIQNWMGVKDKVDTFIFPSSYTLNKYEKAGFNGKKLVCIPTFFNDNILRKDLNIEYKPYALYIGRIDPDKGIKTLLDAFIDTDYNLKIIGFSKDGYHNTLMEYVKGKKHCIEFLGRMDFHNMQDYLSKCLFTVVPSEWYDNLPNTILESYAFKKCVLATNIGSLAENVSDNETGLLFRYKDKEDLRNKAKSLFEHPEKAVIYGENARQKLHTVYSTDKHIDSLLNVFGKLV